MDSALLAGVSIGIPLASIAFFAMVGGSASILLLASSPLDLTHNALVSLCATPFVWAILAGFAVTASNRAGVVAYLFAMSCHCFVNLFYLQDVIFDFGRASGELQWIGLGLYAAGQVTVWTIFAFALRRGIVKRGRAALNRLPTPVYYTSAARRAASDDRCSFED